MIDAMKKLTSILGFLLLTASCSQNIDRRITGRYINLKDSTSRIDLNPNGQFWISEGEKATKRGDSQRLISGYFKVKDDILVVTLERATKDFGIPEFRDADVELKRDGKTLIGNSGSRYIKISDSNLEGTQVRSENVLTEDKVERALNKWKSTDGTIAVLGVHEIPAENRAVADLRFDNYHFTSGRIGGADKVYSGAGDAQLIHYNDGRWILSKVTIGQGFDAAWWDNINIEVK
jgi:hypothetical protein